MIEDEKLKEKDLKDLDDICDECKEKDESVSQNLILTNQMDHLFVQLC